ncbi:hypothetical protein FRC07_007358 [Ceratobasidium sp. 392]|nr:hypothetical protein FRC07_007358 [Ceratobasidium sp. 392]
MLSKHSMHADAARYIAYSGEMFVRRIGTRGWEDDEKEDADARADAKQDGSKDGDSKVKKHPPSQYELVIDNDSGTYRPDKKLLSLLAEFLGCEANLGGPGGLGKITTMDGFDEGLKDTKKRRAEAKKSQSGSEGGETRQVQARRGSSVSSIGSMSSGEVEQAIRKGAQGQEQQGEDANGEANQGGAEMNSVGKAMGEGKAKISDGKEKMGELKDGVAGVVGS